MITRTHVTEETSSKAVYSDCERYRYSLCRTWDNTADRVVFIMLNPSKATEIHNDPTIERCERRSRALGFGAFCAVNIFAWRETDPLKMRKVADPVGPDNDDVIKASVDWADAVIAAWGTHGAQDGRGPEVAGLLQQTAKPIHVLGLTKQGHPKHPLYIKYIQQPMLWQL